MNNADTAKIVYIMKAVYPKYYKDYSNTDFSNMITAWSAVFLDYPYEVVNAGLNAYLTSDTNGFPPSPGQIIDKITTIGNQQNGELNENEAWALVRKAIGNASYNSREEFEKLPPIVQKTVGSPENLRNAARMNLSEVETVEKSLFQRNYRAQLDRKHMDDKIPGRVKEIIKNAAAMIGTDSTHPKLQNSRDIPRLQEYRQTLRQNAVPVTMNV